MVDRLGRTELHYCASDGDVMGVRDLIDGGADPNVSDKNGFTPLHFAAQEWHSEVAEVLISSVAVVDSVNMYGNTPLFVAVANSRGRGELIELLRRHGADPLRANTSGRTPVGFARLVANYDITQFFDDVE
jgi:ankyrin repeat protein